MQQCESAGELEAVVAVEKFTHSMKDLCDELDKRIDAAREVPRQAAKAKVNGKVAVEKNGIRPREVSNSLAYAKDARRAMAKQLL